MLSLLRLGTFLLFFHSSACELSTTSTDSKDSNLDDDSVFGYIPFSSGLGLGDSYDETPDLIRAQESCRLGKELCEQFVAQKACDALLLDTEHCPEYNPLKNWMSPCYCAEGELLKQEHLCCQFRNQTVDLSRVKQSLHTIHMFNATNLRLSVDPNKVDSLHIYDSDHVDICTGKEVSTASGSTFGAVNSSGLNVPQFKNIRLHESSFFQVDNIMNLQSISVVKSSIVNIGRLTINEIPNKRPKPNEIDEDKTCFIFEKARIHHMDNSFLRCSGIFNTTQITELFSVRFDNLNVLDTIIGTVYHKGLTVMKSHLVMNNVRIKYLHRHSVWVSPDVTLSLNNIIVDHCDEPCFLVEEIILLKNVTLNGRRYINTTDAAFDNPLSPGYRLPTTFQVTPSTCLEKRKAVLQCKFWDSPSSPEELYLINVLPRRYHVKVADHSNLRIFEGCQLSVEITNVTGSFFPFADLSCGHKVRVKIENSNLTSFVSLIADTFKSSGSTNIEFFNIDNEIQSFSASGLRIGQIETITFHTESSGTFRYSAGSINVIKKLILYSPAIFVNTSIDKIVSLHIESKSPLEQPIVIKDCDIGAVRKHGINVEKGALKLSNVSLLEASPEMFKIGNEGMVLLDKVDQKMEENCMSAGPLFSAIFRHQVVLLDGPAPSWLFECIAYRPGPACLSSGNNRRSLSNSICLDPTSHCTRRSSGKLVCELSSVNTPILLGNNSALNDVRNIHIIVAKELIFGEHCLTEVILEDSKVMRMEEFPWTCYFNLEIISSEINLIENGIWSLVLSSSSVDTLSLEKARKIIIESSTIHELFLTDSFTVKIVNSNVTLLEEVSLREEMNVINCFIKDLKSIVVNKEASLTLSHTTIKLLRHKAIIVYGSLILDNVDLEESAEGGIWIAREGKLNCSNLYLSKSHGQLSDLFEWQDSTQFNGKVCSP